MALPTRLGISRRVARSRTGRERFFTQVHVGQASAVLLPWQEGTPAALVIRPARPHRPAVAVRQ